MQTVLIADRSEQFCRILADRMRHNFTVETCCGGEQVLERYLSCRPDILILDMELPELDGISILHTLRGAGHHTPVITLTTCIQSDYVLQTLAGFGVEYILAKPCTAAAVLANVHEILCRRDGGEYRLDDEINGLLLTMGFRSNLGGYPCLVEAIRVFSSDTTQQVTKTVYPEVAKICGGTAKRVERAIRGTIQDAWSRRNDSIWAMFFAPGRKSQSAPSNSHFIARLAMCLDNRKTG